MERAYVDKGYRGHETATHAVSSSPVRSAACSVPSSASYNVIRHRSRHRSHEERWPSRRCYLKGRDGDAANAILTAVGYDFRWLRWLGILVPHPDRAPAQLRDPFNDQIGLLTADKVRCPEQ